jgi:beta-glucosidase
MGCDNTSGFPAAAATAAAADVTFVVIGLTCNWETTQGPAREAEGSDRQVIELPSNQYALVSSVRAAIGSKPLIAVLVHGGTFALGAVLNVTDGVLDAWYPSQQGGNAIADVIFGFYNPAGRASATYYASTADLPPNLAQQDLYPNASTGYAGLTYRYYTGTPVVPFGRGLSYTTFTYTNLSTTAAIGACDVIRVSVTVTNSGTRSGDEVVQLYLSQRNASVPVPAIRLADFRRLKAVAPGESRTVELAVAPEVRSVFKGTASSPYTDLRQIEAGLVSLSVGGGQPQFTSGTLSASVVVTGSAPLNSC